MVSSPDKGIEEVSKCAAAVNFKGHRPSLDVIYLSFDAIPALSNFSIITDMFRLPLR